MLRGVRTQSLAPANPRAATAARSALRTGGGALTQALFGAFFLCSHMAVNMCYRPQESVYHPAGANTHTPRRTQTPHDSVISPQPTMVSFGACFGKKTFFVFWQARSAIWIPVGRRGPGFRVCINQCPRQAPFLPCWCWWRGRRASWAPRQGPGAMPSLASPAQNWAWVPACLPARAHAG